MPKTIVTAIRPYLPTAQDFKQLLPFFLAAIAVMLLGQVGAQTIDGALGGPTVTTKGCTFIKSIETSIFLKLFCAGLVLWGVVKYLPTRKDGVGLMIAGVVGFLVLSKFTVLLTTFGMNC